MRVAVIGAGSSGIATSQVLKTRGIPFDCFEKGSTIGGNWRFGNDNGVSSAYWSLHINTSRRQMAYPSFPMPDDYPDYPHHKLIVRYFDDYVEHFGLLDHIRFRTEVTTVEPAGDGRWLVRWRGIDDGVEGSETYDAVAVANGHHWNPRWPEPPFPGSDSFVGQQIHAHHYKTPDVLEDKRVLVLGIGNSGADIAVESSRVAETTYLAVRRGAHVLPKYLRGKPVDEANTPMVGRLPIPLQRMVYKRLLGVVQGQMTDYGLPEPDHKLLEGHPTVSSELLSRIGHGDITVKPNIERFDGDCVRFVDGTEAPVDLVIYCTGYMVTFPFLDEGLVPTADNRVELYRLVVPPDLPGLYFIGLLQPLGAIMPLAEVQSEWVADLIEGKASLPRPDVMRRVIRRENARRADRYYQAARHTIEVDFHSYLRVLKEERGRRPGRRSSTPRTHELRLSRPLRGRIAAASRT
jgi:dimethylaniline monooxygenase (N-oxide forming)